ncbi:uncharacterized protein EV154DRAFT_417640 [Mucor mucedo]|uniref:uncharacterized protein n=1 Tax=Mucor mucedo TaxID=29922 RepID=UPI00221E6918|nr:uncharacterized protein EV154DRAFT_417640 [Mucor mucedo]KAI7893009.1 hypothetical protein EV154DRAFT_417640 [Mucor mucedo]
MPIIIIRDNTSLTTCSKSPDNVCIRPDVFFSTILACGTELEIANGEIKRPGASKCEVDKARVRVLETAKRHLHLLLKTTSAAHKHVTFDILIYDCSFEFYNVRFIYGLYPYEKISWGQLPRLNSSNLVLEHTLCSILTLKHSMLMSVAGEDTAPITVTDMHLLPTVTYCEY